MHRSDLPSAAPRRLRRALCAVSLLLAGAAAPAQGVFPPPGPDVLHSPLLTMIDPEFNLARSQVTWVDVATGDIWVAGIDPLTGAFVPADGRGTRIEARVSQGGEYPGLGFTINGPEWAFGASGDFIVYTRTESPGDPKPTNALVGVAYPNADGTWTRQSLATPRRFAPYGSLDRGVPARVAYQDPRGAYFVRALEDPTSEVKLPGFARNSLAPPTARFVEDTADVVYQAKFDGVSQTVAFDLDARALRQLTHDGGNKEQSWLWRAPEFGGALALVAVVDKREVVLYLPQVAGDGSTRYEPAMRIAAPQRGKWFSVEPFVHQGRSYFVAQLTPRGSSHPRSIWLAGFDAADPMLRQLTPDGVATEARADPEVLPTAQGVRVVYSKFDTTRCTPENTSSWLCMSGLMGLFSADTGLPP